MLASAPRTATAGPIDRDAFVHLLDGARKPLMIPEIGRIVRIESVK
jgi:hypothetical protein